jgi:tetratricopeptide (TPR) repeat protein
MKKYARNSLYIAMLAIAAACSTGPKADIETTGVSAKAAPTRAAAVEPRVATGSAARTEHPKRPEGNSKPPIGEAATALIKQAEDYARAGVDEKAAASLERAVGIEPNNPWIWHYLGVLRMQQTRWQEAQDIAIKSISLAGGNKQILGGNWKVIAIARAKLGDNAGAVVAERRAQNYLRAKPED